MSVLQVSPDSSELVRAAAALVLFVHISAGSIGLLSGSAALAFRKGSRLHGWIWRPWLRQFCLIAAPKHMMELSALRQPG